MPKDVAAQIVHPDPRVSDAVSYYAGSGLPLDQVARQIGLTRTDMHTHYSVEYGRQNDMLVHKVASKLWAKALQRDDTTAQIFILKCRGGWRQNGTQDTTVSLTSIGGLKVEIVGTAPDSDDAT